VALRDTWVWGEASVPEAGFLDGSLLYSSAPGYRDHYGDKTDATFKFHHHPYGAFLHLPTAGGELPSGDSAEKLIWYAPRA
jgi:hypothetical protein